MNTFKYKGREKEIQMLIDEFGVIDAAKKLDTTEKLLRKACYSYKIKIPEYKPDMTESHPRYQAMIEKGNRLLRSMPFGDIR